MMAFAGDTQTQATGWAKWNTEQIWIFAGSYLIPCPIICPTTRFDHPWDAGNPSLGSHPAYASRRDKETEVPLETEGGTLAGMQHGSH